MSDFKILDPENRFDGIETVNKNLLSIEEMNDFLESHDFESMKSILKQRIKIIKNMEENEEPPVSSSQLVEQLHHRLQE